MRILTWATLALMFASPAVPAVHAECCPVHRPDRADVNDPAAWARSEKRVTAEGLLASVSDGVMTIEISGQRFTTTPDKGTKFSAEKWTPLAGRKNLALSDFEMGSPVRVTFVADSGKLLEVRLRHEKLLDAQAPVKGSLRAAR